MYKIINYFKTKKSTASFMEDSAVLLIFTSSPHPLLLKEKGCRKMIIS